MARPSKKQTRLSNPAEQAEALAAAVDQLAHERVAHLVKDAARAFIRSLQIRLVPHTVSYGHWTILRVLWDQDGLSQRALAELSLIHI